MFFFKSRNQLNHQRINFLYKNVYMIPYEMLLQYIPIRESFFLTSDRHRLEIVTLNKYIAEYEQK